MFINSGGVGHSNTRALGLDDGDGFIGKRYLGSANPFLNSDINLFRIITIVGNKLSGFS